MTNDLMPFTSLAEMLDAVLEAPPPRPEPSNWRRRARRRNTSCSFAPSKRYGKDAPSPSTSFDLNADIFYEIAEQGERAFAAGLLGLPYPVFAGLTTLTLHGEPASAIVMAEEVPQAEHGLPTDDPVLCVYAVRPLRWPDEAMWSSSGSPPRCSWRRLKASSSACRWSRRSTNVETAMLLEIPLSTLFVMLTVLADDRTAIRRTVAPVEVNDGARPARASADPADVDRQRRRPHRALFNDGQAEAAAQLGTWRTSPSAGRA